MTQCLHAKVSKIVVAEVDGAQPSMSVQCAIHLCDLAVLYVVFVMYC